MKMNNNEELIEEYCMRENYLSYDPYDIWKTQLGIISKRLFFKNKYLGLPFVSLLTLLDFYIINKKRFFYKKKEYPIVSAQNTIVLLNKLKKTKNKKYLEKINKNIDWLLNNYSKKYKGLSWGTGFKIVISSNVVYDEQTPFTTNTPYILEAFDLYYNETKSEFIVDKIKKIYEFYEKEVIIIENNENYMITSYGPFNDRIVTNSVSYTMYSYSIFYKYLDEKEYIKNKIIKLYNFIKHIQKSDGSWLYAPFDSNTFIDCFHTCFILKNIYKTNLNLRLINSEKIIEVGYDYLKKSFYDNNLELFRRFSIKNKPSIVKYDLYDNAEILNLAYLLKDNVLYEKIYHSINKNFIKNNNVYSQLDLFMSKKNKNMYRWALSPYLIALSNHEEN